MPCLQKTVAFLTLAVITLLLSGAQPNPVRIALTNPEIRQFMADHYGEHYDDHADKLPTGDWFDATRLTSHSICASLNIMQKGQPQLLLAVCNENPENPGLNEPGTTDFYALEKSAGRVTIAASTTDIRSGTFGAPARVDVVRLGSTFYGFRQTGADSAMVQGCGQEFMRLYAAHNGEFPEVLKLTVQYETQAVAPEEEGDAVPGVNYRIKVDVDTSQPDLPEYPLLTHRVDEFFDYAKNESLTGVKKGKVIVLHFDEKRWKYVVPKAFRPIKDGC
jgi:hypothetical protein